MPDTTRRASRLLRVEINKLKEYLSDYAIIPNPDFFDLQREFQLSGNTPELIEYFSSTNNSVFVSMDEREINLWLIKTTLHYSKTPTLSIRSEDIKIPVHTWSLVDFTFSDLTNRLNNIGYREPFMSAVHSWIN